MNITKMFTKNKKQQQYTLGNNCKLRHNSNYTISLRLCQSEQKQLSKALHPLSTYYGLEDALEAL